MAHLKYSPSGAGRWMICAASIPLSQYLPDMPAHQSALQGTIKHEEAAEHLIKRTNSEDPHLNVYLDEVRQHKGELVVEHEVKVHSIHPELGGTLDAGIISDAVLRVIDLKYGKSPVSPVENKQLLIYMLGLIDEGFKAKKYELVIVQPRTGWPVKRWQTTESYLSRFADKVAEAIERTLDPNPIMIAGSHCFFCKAKHMCPAHLEYKGLM